MVPGEILNAQAEIALRFINHTNTSVFLTGKAGTGKTSFLRALKNNCRKNLIVLAPTGVAAINAGGTTMHSFFQLPLGLFLPQTGAVNDRLMNVEISDPYRLIRNVRYSSAKRELLEELELMVIDEISMVRADALDAIDVLLRHFRNKQQPFGGVQVLFIGDLYQLPPVMPHSEWDLLQTFYKSPFFFSAQVIHSQPPVYIELETVYRQNEQIFIDILNHIREQTVSSTDLEFLNSHFLPGGKPKSTEAFITITTHNRIADTINEEALKELPSPQHIFSAVIEGEFSDRAYPVDQELTLKSGAQIMFIKNDSGPERRFYNGKIGRVTAVKSNEIKVKFEDEDNEFVVEREVWKNIRYRYQQGNQVIEEEEIGSYSQYPLRLAWAITVHKSQGLTFKNAIIDAAGSFAPGQVYVALSRCTSLSGLVLRSQIPREAISTDSRIVEFVRASRIPLSQLNNILSIEEEKYAATLVAGHFNFQRMHRALLKWNEFVVEREAVYKADALRICQELIAVSKNLQLTADKFRLQIHQLFSAEPKETNGEIILDRLRKAIGYFGEHLALKLLQPVRTHRSEARLYPRSAKYVELLSELEILIWQQLVAMRDLKVNGNFVNENRQLFAAYEPGKALSGKLAVKDSASSSASISLELFKDGKTLQDIATLRKLTVTTVENHLAGFAGTEIEPAELVAGEVLEQIIKVMADHPNAGATTLKNLLPAEISFFAIRVALNYSRVAQRP